ncbi:VWA domain-containing protein [Pseudomonas tremae]|uniref:VWA domain-containing protein n=1 Tax=Pseudomonas tremae TaxID=200454 RepID=A0ABV4PCQ3_9PSED|nr:MULTISPECIES: VWA domain-containing protein [Pseudomonas syringae group]KGS13924.1 magnesium chelatase [Pseudomonas coronafaciens]MCQ3014134.1 VWA domain-containing protein [Pseudomonas tremae]MCQ3027028.1 VWA domain-containing protein [Pseudomonas tremae]QGL57284.1 VWA domain-containing protein [Pseudomonas coronafaciens pv. oryzae str. 1_6]
MASGRQGAIRAGAEGLVQWLPTLLRGRPKSRKDLVRQPRSARPSELLLVIVDASASTRRHQALSQAKGLLSQVFDDAYRRRARLALLTASGAVPRWQHQGLKASAALVPWLDGLGAGGGTPLTAALEQARAWLEQRQKRYPAEQHRVLVMTDGRIKQLPVLSAFTCASLLIDIEKGPIRLGRARELASSLGAEYRHIDELKEV